mgnify:CR=1 FL=1
MQVAYIVQRDDDRSLDIDAMFVINRVVDALFAVDMVLQFFTARLNADSSLVTDLRVLARRYVKGWFIVDVVSVFPFDIIGAAIFNRIHFLRILRLLRLAKMTRLLRTNRVVGSGAGRRRPPRRRGGKRAVAATGRHAGGPRLRVRDAERSARPRLSKRLLSTTLIDCTWRGL